VPTGLEEALLALARRIEPAVRRVRLPSATLKSTEDVGKYVDEVRATLEEEIEAGPIVVS
jgi:hypothetical protein